MYDIFQEHIESGLAHEDGKPVIAIYGVAFDEEKHPTTQDHGMVMIEFFKNK
jgi:hypothetical protein